MPRLSLAFPSANKPLGDEELGCDCLPTSLSWHARAAVLGQGGRMSKHPLLSLASWGRWRAIPKSQTPAAPRWHPGSESGGTLPVLPCNICVTPTLSITAQRPEELRESPENKKVQDLSSSISPLLIQVLVFFPFHARNLLFDASHPTLWFVGTELVPSNIANIPRLVGV